MHQYVAIYDILKNVPLFLESENACIQKKTPRTTHPIKDPPSCRVRVRVRARGTKVQGNMEGKGRGGPWTLERVRWVSGRSVPGREEVVGVLACFSPGGSAARARGEPGSSRVSCARSCAWRGGGAP